MDEVIERRKWLWSRKKGDRRDALDAGSARSTGGHHHRRVRRRPTLSNFLAECERYRRRNSSMATGSGSAAGGGLPIDDVNFRLQQRYWGKIHRRTPTPKSSSSSSSSSSSNTSCTTSGSRSSSCCSTHTTRTHSPSLCSNCTRSSASRPSPLLEGEKVGHVHGQPGSDLIGDEHQQQQQLVVDEEENELLGVRRKTSRLRAAVRPLSTSALPDPPCTPTMPTAPGGMPIRKKSSGGVQMLFRGGSDQRTKRDSRGRRLGGEWDKRLERRGDDVVALFDERGVGAASGTREREQLDNDDAATMAHAETGTTTTGYMSTLRRSTVTTTAARRRRLSRRRKRRERRMARTFSQPNLGTLERFEKVSA